jgi:2-keto-4-pentenoate hydratase/2-oxohepta-3-ene-1,7-dioic acid hydratase in catechol pathway
MTRFVRCLVDGEPVYGIIEGQEVAVIEPHPFTIYAPSGRRIPIQGLRLLAPVIPSKIVAVGRNYVDHAAEMGDSVPTEPLLFLKPSTAVIGPGDPIRLPTDLSDEVHYEGEIALVIGALLSRVTPEVAAKGILGVTCANDVTLRDVQRREEQWARAKGFDGSCPLGPAITTGLDLNDLRLRTYVDDELRQEGVSSDMVFDIPRIVSEISRSMTLLPGDVVLTGTPAGVGVLEPGQRVRIEIDGVGALENPVVDRDASAGVGTVHEGRAGEDR